MIIQEEIEARVDELMANLPYLNKTEGGVEGFKVRLRRALVEVSDKPNITTLERAVIDAAVEYVSTVRLSRDDRVSSRIVEIDEAALFAAVDTLAAKGEGE